MNQKRKNVVLCSGFAICGLISTNASAALIDLLISEVMANPVAVSDTVGEWFELYNHAVAEAKRLGMNIDLTPTILDIAGIDIPDAMHGRSLLAPATTTGLR